MAAGTFPNPTSGIDWYIFECLDRGGSLRHQPEKPDQKRAVDRYIHRL